jgi:hypothetical protein
MHRRIALALLVLAAAGEVARADWRVIDQKVYSDAVKNNHWLAVGYGGGVPGYSGYWIQCVDISRMAGWADAPHRGRKFVVNVGQEQWVWQRPNWPLACQYARRTVAVEPPQRSLREVPTTELPQTPRPTVYAEPPRPSPSPRATPSAQPGTGSARDPRGRVTGRGNSTRTNSDPDPYGTLPLTGR